MSLAELNPVASLRASRRRAKTAPLRPRATALAATGAVAAPVPAREAQPLRARRYWIEHCEGFRVDGQHGRIGVVEEVRRADGSEPLLVIRAGILGRRVVEISAQEVFEIVPRARRLWLRTPESSRATTRADGSLEAARARAAA